MYSGSIPDVASTLLLIVAIRPALAIRTAMAAPVIRLPGKRSLPCDCLCWRARSHVAGLNRRCSRCPGRSRIIAAPDFINGAYDIRWLEKFVAGEV